MSDAAVAVPVAPKATPKKVKAAKAKTVKTSSHPSYQDMIKKAVETLKERNGSSRQAIQKYIQANYKTCDDKISQARLKVALKRGAEGERGFLKRVKGVGASGSFRLNAAAPKAVKPKKPVVKKAAAAKKPKVAGEKKVKAAKPKSVKAKTAVKPKPKKAVAEKKTTAKPKIVKKPATPKKAVKPVVKKATTPKAKKPAVKKAPAKK